MIQSCEIEIGVLSSVHRAIVEEYFCFGIYILIHHQKVKYFVGINIFHFSNTCSALAKDELLLSSGIWNGVRLISLCNADAWIDSLGHL